MTEGQKADRMAEARQDLKKQRITTYFVEAAKEMVAKEGMEGVSVRKVADAAGYSYATLYNYFRDLNELLWEVRKTMVMDLAVSLQEKLSDVVMDEEGIKKVFRAYLTYYFENPHIFKFFYFQKIVRPETVQEEDALGPGFDAMTIGTFSRLVQEGRLRESDVIMVGRTLVYAVHGMLTLYFSDQGERTREEIYRELDGMVDLLLPGKSV